MKLRRKSAAFVATIAILTIPTATAFANDAVIEIDPGLYAHQHSISVGGQTVIEKEYEYCNTPDISKRRLSDIVTEMQDGGNCTVSNLRHTQGVGEADIVCQNPDFGPMRGNIRAEYTRTSYSTEANATFNGGAMKMRSTTSARRLGDCPPDWTPPPGISHK